MKVRDKGEKTKYQIILLRDNVYDDLISSHWIREKAIEKFNRIVEENKKVAFPLEYKNTNNQIVKVKYNIAVIKRKEDDSKTSVKLKNDYGEYVDHIIEDNDEWIMYAKEPYYFEESFWVYGYNPRVDRKDFKFIYDNLIKKYSKNKYEFLNIWYYSNKIMLENPNHSDLIICKNMDDAERLYNKLEEYCTNDKNKYIMFSGNKKSMKGKSTIALDKIMALTGWNRLKCKRKSTRP